MNPFETETMADLCLRQGHHIEALAIYRRLLIGSADEAARERIARRIAAAERESKNPNQDSSPSAGPGRAPTDASEPEAPLPSPGVRARRSGDTLTIEWRLPPRTEAPGLEVLLVIRGPSGVATEKRVIDAAGDAGQITLAVKDLHLVRVAVGSRAGGRFVPLARV